MRIVHVSDCYLPRVGGIERQVHDLAQRQSDHGHQVEIVTSVAGQSPDSYERIAVHRPESPSTRQSHAIRYLSSRVGRDVVLAGGYDVIHLHVSTWSPLTYLTARSAARVGIPTVATLHSLWSYATPLFGVADGAFHWGDWPIIWSAVSSVAAGSLDRFTEARQPVSVLPNGVDPSAWRTEPSTRDPDRVVIATVGRLTERKRPRQFLATLREVRVRLPMSVELEVMMIGDGPLRKRLQRYLDRHDMSWWVRLVGAVDHQALPGMLEQADIYVAPARLESFGIAALEARCVGLPVVAFAGSGVADFVRHGVEGMLATDDDQMAEMIVELAASPGKRSLIRAHNRSTSPESVWPDVLARCDELYTRARRLSEPTRMEEAEPSR